MEGGVNDTNLDKSRNRLGKDESEFWLISKKVKDVKLVILLGSCFNSVF
jgi:hypothetical protein